MHWDQLACASCDQFELSDEVELRTWACPSSVICQYYTDNYTDKTISGSYLLGLLIFVVPSTLIRPVETRLLITLLGQFCLRSGIDATHHLVNNS